jgi:hypothetical protein
VGIFGSLGRAAKGVYRFFSSSTPESTTPKEVQQTAAKKAAPAQQKPASKVVADKPANAPKPVVVAEPAPAEAVPVSEPVLAAKPTIAEPEPIKEPALAAKHDPVVQDAPAANVEPAEIVTDSNAKGPEQVEETIPRAPLSPIAEEDKGVDEPSADAPLSPIAEEDGREGKLEDTLTNSRNSLKPEVRPVPLGKVNEILTPKEPSEPVVPILEAVNMVDDILPKSIQDEPLVLPVLEAIPDTNPIVGLLEGPERAVPDAGIPQKGVPAFVPPVQGSAQPFVPVAGVVTEHNSVLDKIVKPAGFAVAALTGVGALIGSVWLFGKVKAFFQRKRAGKSRGTSRRKRRHVRDWNAGD